MKKIIAFILFVLTVSVANAQDNHSMYFVNMEIFRICAMIFFVFLVMVFILMIMKRVLDNRLKNKIIEKGISENLALSVLQNNPRDNRDMNIKWFALLAGIGIGTTIVNYTLPLGYHSLAIMAFSIAFSFLGYFFYLKQSGK